MTCFGFVRRVRWLNLVVVELVVVVVVEVVRIVGVELVVAAVVVVPTPFLLVPCIAEGE